MSEPQIIVGGYEGHHNESKQTVQRLRKGKVYRDLSTVCVIPTRGAISARVVECWMGLMTPMNQKFCRVFVRGMEVGDAYNAAVEMILANPELSKWKYLLTLEEDNMPPPDGLLKLYESIEEFSVVGGLYYTKGEGGQPMIYGNPTGILAFNPQVPQQDRVQECNGLGMGFNLFRLSMFKDENIPKPWFKTQQEWNPAEGGKSYSQDLYFYEHARMAGYRVACDTRIKVGHYDTEGDFVW